VADVWHDEQAGAWLLRMRSTCYAFAVGRDGAALRHLHWGAELPPAALAGLRAEAAGGPSRGERHRTWALESPDEYVPWGGMRYDEPSLKVDYPDGTRGIEWQVEAQRSTRRGGAVTLEIELADSVYDLRVTLSYRVFDGFDVLERWATVRHVGAGLPIVVRQAHSANWWLPAARRWRLRYVHGGWGAETQLTDTMLGPGKVVLESRRGTTSHQLNPWFTLDPEASATEESGQVWSGELAWSGSWKLVFEVTSAGRAHACGGWNDFDWAYRLAPGEELVLPSFAGLHCAGGFGGASREWHAWQRAHVLGRGDRTAAVRPGSAAVRPRSAPGGPVADVAREPPLRPVLYNSWEATSFAVSAGGQARLAELAAQIGAECFVVDDGWFTGRRHAAAGLGDWVVDRSKFPAGLTPLIRKVNDMGMRFGLWIEPEMVNPDSDLYRAHPDWVYHFANRARTLQRSQLVLNLARPDVAQWVFDTLDRLLAADNIEFIKWDMNRNLSEPGWPAEAGGNPERIWTEHVRSLYAILDGLRAAHPGVELESCSGGGGRVDLGILARVEQVWTSDNTDAWDRIAIQEGFTQAYAPQVMMAWVTDNPNQITGRGFPLRFRFHAAMAGALGIGGDLNRWSPADLAEARDLVAAYKAIRPVVQRGRLYRLASVSGGRLGASEYVADDGSEVVVLAWWGPGPAGGPVPAVRLLGIDPGLRYRDAGTGQEHWGAALMHAGLRLPADAALDFGSALVRLIRVAEPA